MIVGIAIDSSVHANRAFETYVNDCHKNDHEIILLHVIHVAATADLTKAAVSDHCAAAIKEANSLQQKFETKLAERQIKWVNIQDDKKIGEAIVHAAEEKHIEMIVIGARGTGALRRTFLGTVSDYILHHAKVPVVVCRPEDHHVHHGGQ